MLEKSLIDAGAARDVASDRVRRLEPIVTAARASERGISCANDAGYIFLMGCVGRNKVSAQSKVHSQRTTPLLLYIRTDGLRNWHASAQVDNATKA